MDYKARKTSNNILTVGYFTNDKKWIPLRDFRGLNNDYYAVQGEARKYIKELNLQSQEVKGEIYDMFEFSIRVMNALSSNNITTLKQLLALSEWDLLTMKGMGRKSVNDIKALLAEKNYSLNTRDTVFIPPKVPRLFTKNEIKVIYARCLKKYTFQQIGDELGLTRERIRQIMMKALRKMQCAKNAHL